MLDGLDLKKIGLQTRADAGVFLIGTFAGGAVDAIFDLAAFSEPLVFGAICGTGALGVKSLIDAYRERKHPPSK